MSTAHAEIGPVQMLAVGFDERARFDGSIVTELARLESEGLIKIIDLLYMRREADSGELMILEDDRDREHPLGRLVINRGQAAEVAPDTMGRAFRLASDDIAELADALDPGQSVGLVCFEHVWARPLRNAISAVGGIPFMEGFLTPETLAVVVP